MKVKNYNQVLRARGYRVVKHTDYQGVNVYVKIRKYNIATCTVVKDSHGKGQSINITITSQISTNPEVKKEIKLDADYLTLEATKIIEAFATLKELKSPKHIYCF